MNQKDFKKTQRTDKKNSTSIFLKQKQVKNSFRNTKIESRNRLDPNLLIKKAENFEVKKYLAERLINEMPLHEKLIKNLDNKGYIYPTEIQDKTLELLLGGNNLLGIAQTGTGKTGAFLIPVINRLLTEKISFKTLVIVPTRELALQVEEEFKSMTKGLGLYSSVFIGGTNLRSDIFKLKRNNHLVVGTPGRLIDLENRKALNLKSFSVLIIDEFDRLLDIGFINDIKKIINQMVQRRQTLLFSATIDKSQKNIIDEILENPEEVKISTGKTAIESVDQDIIKVNRDENKFKVLLKILEQKEFEKVLLFTETKHSVDHLYKQLKFSGINVEHIHGGKSQNSRQIALEKFRKGNIRVLVATDVAARGIDVTDISHVINYQMPKTYENYIHRIGRTGRAGKKGNALTFIN